MSLIIWVTHVIYHVYITLKVPNLPKQRDIPHCLNMPKRLLCLWPGADYPDYFPDEILACIILEAYDWRVTTVAHYEELMEHRTVSLQFNNVIVSLVVPYLREIPGRIVDCFTIDRLLVFKSLTCITLKPDHEKRKQYDALFTGLPLLSVVRIDQRSNDYWSEKAEERLALALKRCQTLTDLTLIMVSQMPIDALLPLTQLHTLHLVQCRAPYILDTLSNLTELKILQEDGAYWGRENELLSPATFAMYMPNLRNLRLRHDQPVYNLERLTKLEMLSIGEEDPIGAITDDTLGKLSLLTKLTLCGHTHVTDEGLRLATQLKDLDLRECPWFSTRAIETLHNLEHLLLYGKGGAHGGDGVMDVDVVSEILPGCEVDRFW